MQCKGSGFRVQGSGFRVQGSEFRVQGSEFRVQNSGFRVQGSGFSVHRDMNLSCRDAMPRTVEALCRSVDKEDGARVAAHDVGHAPLKAFHHLE